MDLAPSVPLRRARPGRTGPWVVALCAAWLSVACASAPGPGPGPGLRTPRESAPPRSAAPAARPDETGSVAVRRALEVVGAPYRWGGTSPERGFDCSGLVVWSYAQAGVAGLPRTAADLERRARPVALDALQPGDLLFFRPSGRKTSHVALYVGDRRFVHAPSPGQRVEVVGFDHVYWGGRISGAGRIAY